LGEGIFAGLLLSLLRGFVRLARRMNNNGAERMCFGLIELLREGLATVGSVGPVRESASRDFRRFSVKVLSTVGSVRESALRNFCRCSAKVVSTLMDELDIPRTPGLVAVGGFKGVKSVRTEIFEGGPPTKSVEDFFV
jgi:hypothetical protein